MPHTRPMDRRDLAQLLTRPYELAATLCELNHLQLSVLQWLAQQPDHASSWEALTAEVGDRVPAEDLLRFLQDLRLWGLADFEPNPGDGFVATYNAVVAALPRGRLPGLRPFLQALTTEQLYILTRRIGIAHPPTRKEERIKALMQTAAHPASVRQRVDALSEDARHLFESIRKAGVRETRSSIVANLWPVFVGERHPKQSTSPMQELANACLVIAADHAQGLSWARHLAVPQEVEDTLSPRSAFEGPLQLPRLEPAEEVTQAFVPSPGSLFRDLGHLLGFIDAGMSEWRQDGKPYQRSMQAFAKKLGFGDHQYGDFLFHVALMLRLLEPDGRSNLVLDQEELDELDPHEAFEKIVEWWARGGAGDWLGSHRTAQPRRRFLGFLALCPAGVWVTRQSVIACLEYLWPLIFSREHGRAAHDQLLWSEASRFLLGQGVTADGQEALLVPSQIQAALLHAQGEESAADTQPLAPWESHCTVLPDRTLIAPPDAHPALLATLWQVADLESCQGASVFRISPASVDRALNRAYTPDDVLSLLQQVSDRPLPQTVERLVDDKKARYGRVKVGAADAYVRAEDPAWLDEVMAHRRLSNLPWVRLAPNAASVAGVSDAQLLEMLAAAGFLPLLDETPPNTDSTEENAPHPGLRLGRKSL